ncbi:MAG: class I SAM-dependent methyltransferase [Bacteroidales bacterium]|nr:class I SAM-dependent methyltransferase [Bacteroidales bacterium]
MSTEFDPLQHYIETHSSEEDELLYQLNRETHLKVVNPRMLSGRVQGKFLEFISRMVQPSFILEIGTFTGYSAICLARGLRPGGKMITIEVNDELSDYALRYFQKAGLEEQIELITGDALEIIPKLDRQFDLVFIDGDKKEYPAYYELIIDKLNPGGCLLADNVLWGGKVVEDASYNDPETAAIKKFNKLIKEDKRVENVIISIRDGISLIRKN